MREEVFCPAERAIIQSSYPLEEAFDGGHSLGCDADAQRKYGATAFAHLPNDIDRHAHSWISECQQVAATRRGFWSRRQDKKNPGRGLYHQVLAVQACHLELEEGVFLRNKLHPIEGIRESIY